MFTDRVELVTKIIEEEKKKTKPYILHPIQFKFEKKQDGNNTDDNKNGESG